MEKVKYTQLSDAEVVNFEGSTKKKHELKASFSEEHVLHSWLDLSVWIWVPWHSEKPEPQHYMLCVSGDFDWLLFSGSSFATHPERIFPVIVGGFSRHTHAEMSREIWLLVLQLRVCTGNSWTAANVYTWNRQQLSVTPGLGMFKLKFYWFLFFLLEILFLSLTWTAHS